MLAPSRALGVLLLVAAFAPLHRLLDPAVAGPAGAATREAAEIAWSLGGPGSLIVVVLAWLGSRMVRERTRIADIVDALWRRLLSGSDVAFVTGVSLLVLVLSGAVAFFVHSGQPTSVDEMAQLVHARALADGRLLVPFRGDPAASFLQNGWSAVVRGQLGWVSIYPPGHTLMLAIGSALGASWMVGPALTALSTGAVTLATGRLLDRVTGRVTGLLLAASPYWLLLGATHLSHTTAVAGLSVVLLASQRVGSRASLLTGVAVGIAVCARPWTGLIGSIAILGGSWAIRGVPERRDVIYFLLGGLPFAVLLLAWNNTLFGHPLALGYQAAFGPDHGLGFHRDPWGNQYGTVEALAYTMADLAQLGLRLFEGPLPAIAVVGGLLLLRPAKANAVFVAWVVALLGANALYWHHGIHFGPRMLYEATPAFVALFATALTSVFSRVEPLKEDRRFARWCLGLTLVGGLIFTPAVLVGNRGKIAEALPPAPPASLVFVHGSASSRVAATLVAEGMRRDSVETALRRNDFCLVLHYAELRRNGALPLPTLDLVPLPGTPSHLEALELSPGNRVRVGRDQPPSPECRRELEADRFGVQELELLAWQFSGSADEGTRWIRDLGPDRNRDFLLEPHDAAFFLIPAENGALTLIPYDEGIEAIWSGEPTGG